jgi:acyl carrier protein
MMNRNEVLESLNKIFIDVFDNEEISITEKTDSNEITEWDSLAHVTLIATIEKEFNIKFKMNDILNAKTVGDLVNIIIRES